MRHLRAKNTAVAAKKMLAKSYSTNEISELTGLSIEALNKAD